MIPEGFGTALKPAWEGITVARKPLTGTVAANVLEHGTGALNVDGGRIAHNGRRSPNAADGTVHRPGGVVEGGWADSPSFDVSQGRWPANVLLDPEAAELLDAQTGNVGSFLPPGKDYAAGQNGAVFSAATPHRAFGYGDSGGASRFFYVAKASRAERSAGLTACDGTLCLCPDPKDQELSPPRDTSGLTEADDFDSSTTGNGSRPTDRSQRDTTSTTSTESRLTIGSRTSRSSAPSPTSESTRPTTAETTSVSGSDAATSAESGSHPTPSTTTSAAKAGLSTDDAARAISHGSSRTSSSAVCADCKGVIGGAWKNTHPLEPTVKPIALMRWLVRLVTPPGGTVLDPFTGSGTTGIAAVLEGFDFIGIEREAEYVSIAQARIAHWAAQPVQLGLEEVA